MKKFIFDTSTWIFCSNEAYPISNFPIVWNSFLEKKNYEIHYIDAVVGEIEEGKPDDKLRKWFKGKKPSLTKIKQTTPKDIVNTYYAKAAKPPKADPFIIATAKEHTLIVVTQEKNRGHSEENPKIPAICKKEKITCMPVNEFWQEVHKIFEK